MTDRWSLPVAGWLFACLTLAYLPDIGHGFIADDFAWVAHGHVAGVSDLTGRLLMSVGGFFRPVLLLSFAANRMLSGVSPFGFALGNLLLACAVAAAIVALVRARGFSVMEGLFAAGVWAFNLHGPGMALLWISGRASLLATLGAVLAARATVQGRTFAIALWTAFALGSTEEALPLALLLSAWRTAAHQRDGRSWGIAIASGLRDAWSAWAVTALYAAARMTTDAMTITTAPPEYRHAVYAAAPDRCEPRCEPCWLSATSCARHRRRLAIERLSRARRDGPEARRSHCRVWRSTA